MIETGRHPLRGRILLALFLLVGSFALPSRAAAFPDWTECPAVCRCKWTSGKKSALCPDAGLTSLPASLDPDMQVLDLSGNNIPALQSEIFKRAGLLNLQRVFLRNAGIHEIHADSFRDMRILVEIDLSDNHVESLDPNTFQGNERLRILILSGNPLGTLKDHQFPVLQHLRTLELQRCALIEIHGQALIRLAGLETLRLDDNGLEYLEASIISTLPRLKTLTLDGNRWSCDCRLRGFRAWLIPNTPRKLYSVSQVCNSPSRVQGRRWEDVKPTEFACEPQVFVVANTVQEETNGNLSLACLATGDPEPEVWWQLNGGPMNVTKSNSALEERRGEMPADAPVGLHSGNNILILNNKNKNNNNANKLGIGKLRNGFGRASDKWSNITVYNVSDSDAGEYACFARNIAGLARDSVSVAIPRVQTAPTLSQSDNWLLWVSLAGGGAAALCASISALMVALCVCGGAAGSRRAGKREKVERFQGSTSFGEHEKKLLDLSVTTTTGGSAGIGGNSIDRTSGSLAEACSTGDLELTEHGSICDPLGSAAATVTIERLRVGSEIGPATANSIRAVPCVASSAAANIFPPPPPEFTTGVLPAGIFGNIFISVSLPQDSDRCYPDLLDIPVHATVANSVVPDKSLGVVNVLPAVTPITSSVPSFATLPRRALRSATTSTDLSSPYDNMGPRVTANGSSAFSLTDMDFDLSTGSLPRVIQPPHEFVSL